MWNDRCCSDRSVRSDRSVGSQVRSDHDDHVCGLTGHVGGKVDQQYTNRDWTDVTLWRKASFLLVRGRLRAKTLGFM